MIGKRNPYRTSKSISGLHNVTADPKCPGRLWVSLQFQNLLLLLDVSKCDGSDEEAVPEVVTTIHVPTKLYTSRSSALSPDSVVRLENQ